MTLPLLKGPDFARELREILEGPVPVAPQPGLQHQRVLVPGLIGGELQFALLGLIIQALRLRGAEVTALMCDAALPACSLRKVDHHESACERWCHRNAPGFADALGLPHRWYSDFLTDDEQARCRRIAAAIDAPAIDDLEFRGVPLGEHIVRSLESYFKVGCVDLDDPAVIEMTRKFVCAATMLTIVGFRALTDLRIDKVLINDGKKTDWGVIRAVAAAMDIPVDIIHIGIRGSSVRFETDRPGRHGARIPDWDHWRDVPLDDGQQRDLDAYLARRARVPYEWRDEKWHLNTTDAETIAARIGLPPARRGHVFAMFPNVGFDAGQTRSASAAFRSPADWAQQTVETLRERPDHHLIIKGHPCEFHRQARDPVVEMVQRRFDPLPPNVHLIPADSDISAHSVSRLADIVLVYTSTVAVEAAALGKPVVLVGGGWNAERGFTYDCSSPESYRTFLEGLCSGDEQCEAHVEIARRYAYSLFFRNDIPVNFFAWKDYVPTTIAVRTWDDLAPGRDAALDVICDGVLRDGAYVNPETDGLALIRGVGAAVKEASATETGCHALPQSM